MDREQTDLAAFFAADPYAHAILAQRVADGAAPLSPTEAAPALRALLLDGPETLTLTLPNGSEILRIEATGRLDGAPVLAAYVHGERVEGPGKVGEAIAVWQKAARLFAQWVDERAPVHMSIEAGQGQGVVLACDPTWTEPAWGRDPHAGLPEGTYRAANGKIYTFTATAVTCRTCRAFPGVAEQEAAERACAAYCATHDYVYGIADGCYLCREAAAKVGGERP